MGTPPFVDPQPVDWYMRFRFQLLPLRGFAQLCLTLVCLALASCQSEHTAAVVDAEQEAADAQLSDEQLLLELQADDPTADVQQRIRLIQDGDGTDWANATRRAQLQACLLFVRVLCEKEPADVQRELALDYRHDLNEMYEEFGEQAQSAKVGQLLQFIHGYQSDARGASS